MAAIAQAVDNAGNYKGKPSMIIANTVKGKGVSFMEGNHAGMERRRTRRSSRRHLKS